MRTTVKTRLRREQFKVGNQVYNSYCGVPGTIIEINEKEGLALISPNCLTSSQTFKAHLYDLSNRGVIYHEDPPLIGASTPEPEPEQKVWQFSTNKGPVVVRFEGRFMTATLLDGNRDIYYAQAWFDPTRGEKETAEGIIRALNSIVDWPPEFAKVILAKNKNLLPS